MRAAFAAASSPVAHAQHVSTGSPANWHEILRSRVWDDYIFRDQEYFWQTSLMEPVAAGVKQDQWFIVQRCEACGFVRRNRTSVKDDPVAVRLLLGRPIPDST